MLFKRRRRKPDFAVTVHCVDSYDFAHYLRTVLTRIEQQEKNYEYQLDLLNDDFSRKLSNYEQRYSWKLDNYQGHRDYLTDLYHRKQDFCREKLALRQMELKKAQQAALRKTASVRRTGDGVTPRPFSSGKHDALLFIEEFEEYASRRNIPDEPEIRISIFQHYLQGPAYEWIRPIIQNPQQFEHFYNNFEAFLDEFSRAFAGKPRHS
ncbi:hypothetical protein TRICI_000004 [Trichomonascus ciferrii]|uniref:DUF4939 domain-containing protein n=1 Tax=Trichomonascus ciferrii TaxID=44093 RepID=A0A642VEN6_9ASCO|nr:hypothetical protein TRICI_000004 [Trichomonascus ciferrii]